MAFFLPAQPLGLASATGLGDMLNRFSQAVPRIIGAGLMLLLGCILASVASKGVVAVIAAGHVEKLSSHVGSAVLKDPTALPRAIGSVVFALILIPVAITALDTLNTAAISQPATAMLRIILNAIPQAITAGLILTLAYYIGKFASQQLTQLLSSTGVDQAIGSLGLPQGSGVPASAVNPVTGQSTTMSPSGSVP